jgi:hypothetical protein
MRGTGFYLEQAACFGADPKLFDAVIGELVLDALSYCDRCPIIPECDAHVKPRKSYFDGVAAGRIWNNGIPSELGLFDMRESD